MLDAASNPHYLKPDEEGIQAVIELIREKTGKEPTHAEAYEVLYRVMNHLYLLNFPPPPDHLDEESFRERFGSRPVAQKRAKRKKRISLTNANEKITGEPGTPAGDEEGEDGAGRAGRSGAAGLRLDPG